MSGELDLTRMNILDALIEYHTSKLCVLSARRALVGSIGRRFDQTITRRQKHGLFESVEKGGPTRRIRN